MTDLLIGPNLFLRRQRAADARACVALYRHAQVMVHCGGPLDVAHANQRFQDALSRPDVLWTVERRSDHRIVGLVETDPESEPLLLLFPECWGKGYATEIVWTLLTCMPERIGRKMVLGGENPAARRVAERCGYRSEDGAGKQLTLYARSDRDQRLATLTDYYCNQLASHTRRLHRELGIPENYANSRHLKPVSEARALEDAGIDVFGRPIYLTATTHERWREMRHAAKHDDIIIQPVSGFRDVRYQADLLRRKLDRGDSMDSILKVSAAPGFSEHHGGHAMDLTTPDCDVLNEDFENTEAFGWLGDNAASFGFSLSFPRDNPHGITYEPWHWAVTSDCPQRPSWP